MFISENFAGDRRRVYHNKLYFAGVMKRYIYKWFELILIIIVWNMDALLRRTSLALSKE